jgi:hypothetical protein
MLPSPEDADEQWMYRTIFPSEATKASSRLIQFNKMNEPIEAEANWNYEDHSDNPETIQLMMSQRKMNITPEDCLFFPLIGTI